MRLVDKEEVASGTDVILAAFPVAVVLGSGR